MRRFLLMLTVLSLPGFSQPAPQQAQPPIVVQVQMPPDSIWTILLKVAIPTILAGAVGGGIALYGVRKTNEHNAAENAANRQHQLAVEIAKDQIAAQAKSRDNQWALKRDVYVNLIKTSAEMLRLTDVMKKLEEAEAPNVVSKVLKVYDIRVAVEKMQVCLRDIGVYGSLAPLIVSEDLLKRALTAKVPSGFENDASVYERSRAIFTEVLSELQAAACQDLWGESEPKAKAEPAP